MSVPSQSNISNTILHCIILHSLYYCIIMLISFHINICTIHLYALIVYYVYRTVISLNFFCTLMYFIQRVLCLSSYFNCSSPSHLKSSNTGAFTNFCKCQGECTVLILTLGRSRTKCSFFCFFFSFLLFCFFTLGV